MLIFQKGCHEGQFHFEAIEEDIAELEAGRAKRKSIREKREAEEESELLEGN